MNQGMQQMGKGQQIAGMVFGQPANAPRGRTPDNMNEIMALARRMTDAQLADVLAGRSLDIPQFAAMTEAMGRRSLRNAFQGAQAMARAKQPSVKDRLLAEAAMPAGLDQLSAPNMEPMSMADGGIVAFSGKDEDQLVDSDVALSNIMRGRKSGLPEAPEPAFGTPEYDEKYGAPGSLKRKLKSAFDYYKSPYSTGDFGRNVSNTLTALGPVSATAPFIPKSGVTAIDKGFATNLLNRARNLFGTSASVDAALGGDQPSQALPVPDTSLPPAKPEDKKGAAGAAPAGGGGGRGGLDYGMPSYDELMRRRSTDYLSKFEGMGDKKRAGLADLKNQLQGSLLLQAASSLLGSPTLAQAGAKFGQQAVSTLSAGRAEQREIENQADQYDFNIAKAREAAEKGDMQLAMQYAQLANQNKYQMGMIDVYKQRNAIMGDAGQLGKVQLGLKNADAQALAEAKARFGNVLTNKNKAAFDDYVRRRAQQLKMENPLTKPYANLGAGDIGGNMFNVVQSLPKGASVIDPTEG